MKRSQLGIVQYVIGTRISSKFFSVSVLRFQRFFEVLKINILFSELIVDEYFIEICRASKSDEVDFQEDGGWKEYYTPKEREKIERERNAKKKDNAVVIHGM